MGHVTKDVSRAAAETAEVKSNKPGKSRTAVFVRSMRLMELLQSGLTYTPAQLAFELGVNRRTVFRDLRRLENAGIHIRFDADMSTYKLVPHFKAVPRMDDQELAALMLAAHFSPLMAVPVVGPAARQAMAHILAKIPEKMQKSVAQILATSVAENEPPTIDGKVLQTIVKEMGRSHRVRITYRPGDSPKLVSTSLAPFRLFRHDEEWYVFGHSTLHGKRKAFLLASIRNASPTGVSFGTPRLVKADTMHRAVEQLHAVHH